MVSDGVSDGVGSFRAAWLLQRCPFGEMERAVRTGKSETSFAIRGRATDLPSFGEEWELSVPEPLPLSTPALY
jgi:hypothetical protein